MWGETTSVKNSFFCCFFGKMVSVTVLIEMLLVLFKIAAQIHFIYHIQVQACHNFFVKKPKNFENLISERAAANFQKSRTPRTSAIIFKNSQI